MKIKINGKFVDVKEGDELELDAKDLGAEVEDQKMLDTAKKIGKAIADEALAGLNLGDTSKLSAKLDKFLDSQYGVNSKLKQILNGKDLFVNKDELTKEEKIIGFFHGLVTNNEHVLKALAEGVEADGGYLFPNEFLGEIIRDLPEENVMRQYVRIIPMKRDKMDITSLVDGLDVFWTGENVAKSTTTARFSQQTLTAFKMAAILYSSDELIEDSTEIDVVGLIIQLFTEAIAEEEERVIWQGDGTTQPQGLAVATLTTVNGTGDLYQDVLNLYYALPKKYRKNAAWFASDSIVKNLESLKDTNGRPIWAAGFEARPDTLKGKPVVVSDGVPERQLYFGDLKKGYFLGDRKRITAKVSQDTETAFTKDQTAIRVVARVGGKVVLPQAIRKGANF